MTFDGSLDRLYFDDSVLRNDGMRRLIEDRQRNQDPRLAHLDHLQDGLEDQVVCLTAIDPLPRIQHLEQAIRLRYGRIGRFAQSRGTRTLALPDERA